LPPDPNVFSAAFWPNSASAQEHPKIGNGLGKIRGTAVFYPQEALAVIGKPVGISEIEAGTIASLAFTRT